MYSFNDLREYVDNIGDYDEKNKKIVLFGVGQHGEFAYSDLKDELSIIAFTDNNCSTWGTQYESLPVISPTDVKNINDVFVIISTSASHFVSIKRQLNDIGIPCLTYYDYRIKNSFSKIEQVYDMFDDESKQIYVNVIMHKLLGDSFADICTPNQYFCLPEFNDILRHNEVFVDCGSYVGDVFEKFIWNFQGIFKRIYAFEPVPRLYNALNFRKERLICEWGLDKDKIITENKFVGKCFDVHGLNVSEVITSSCINDSAQKDLTMINQISIDEYFESSKDTPTFIKVDIEGAEMDMLEGAKEIISKNGPLLAICVYHRFTDLYTIPLTIHSFNPKYKMLLRHHSNAEWETVLYCVN